MPESTDTLLDFAPDPVKCPDCGAWVRPYEYKELGHTSLNCGECGFACCAVLGWPEPD